MVDPDHHLDGMREIPVADVGHPLVDQVGEDGDLRWAVTESRAPVIHLSPARVNLIGRAHEDQRRLVLVTDENSLLTPVFSLVWREAGGAWVVRAAGSGLRDGYTGRALGSIPDVWSTGRDPDAADDLAVGHLRPTRTEAMQVTAIVSVRHPARSSTVLGGPLEGLAQAAAAEPRLAWAPHEPVGAAWDRVRLTSLIRSQMPAETAVCVGGPDVAALVSAQRTRHGIEELTHAVLGVGQPTPDDFDLLRNRLDAVLRSLTATSMPLVALLLARPARRDLLIAPFLAVPPVPLTLLIGPPAVRNFDLDPAEMARRFGAERVGRPRVPGLLFRLGPAEPQAWQRLDAILSALDPVKLIEALGPVRSRLDAERGGRHAES